MITSDDQQYKAHLKNSVVYDVVVKHVVVATKHDDPAMRSIEHFVARDSISDAIDSYARVVGQASSREVMDASIL